MDEGFACSQCDCLYEEHPGRCGVCGHETIDSLSYSEYRQRQRDGEEPGECSDGRSLTDLLPFL
jgi:hypothetical protein